jgi:pimeloyl-ACP methyl ester carboxylesterase
MSTAQGFADVGALRMWYELHGEGRPDRPPLLLLHGGGSTIETNFRQLIPLVCGTRQVIAVEEQGHGHTPGTDRPFTFENGAEDVAAVLEQLEIPRADVLGFSNGGIVAMRLAMRHPFRVRRLIVASAFYQRAGLADGFWDAIGNATLDSMPTPYKDADRELNPDPGHLEQLFNLDTGRTRSFQDWPDSDLEAVRSPTLVLIGDQDIVTPEHAAKMARTIPGARLMVVPGNHGNYLGELLASDGDPSLVRATVPFLLRFLDEDG